KLKIPKRTSTFTSIHRVVRSPRVWRSTTRCNSFAQTSRPSASDNVHRWGHYCWPRAQKENVSPFPIRVSSFTNPQADHKVRQQTFVFKQKRSCECASSPPKLSPSTPDSRTTQSSVTLNAIKLCLPCRLKNMV